MSINLTDAFTVTKGKNIVEASTSAAVNVLVIDYKENSPVMLLTLRTGSVQGKSLVPSTFVASQLTLSINLLTGLWGTDNGQAGQLSDIDLQSLLRATDSIRNATENLFVSTSTVVGNQVPWDTAVAVAVDPLVDAQPIKG